MPSARPRLEPTTSRSQVRYSTDSITTPSYGLFKGTESQGQGKGTGLDLQGQGQGQGLDPQGQGLKISP